MKKNKFVGYNILISLSMFLSVLFGLIGTFSYETPKNINISTGTIENYKHNEAKWYDIILGGSRRSSLNITLKDETFYTATGISYDKIDKIIYDHLDVGNEITIIYEDRGILSPSQILGIEYNDITYLDVEAVLKEYNDNDKIWKTIGPIFIIIIIFF